ncbi:hypothetical protein AB4Z33_21105 [Paenibacillus sp. 2TAB19]
MLCLCSLVAFIAGQTARMDNAQLQGEIRSAAGPAYTLTPAL